MKSLENMNLKKKNCSNFDVKLLAQKFYELTLNLNTRLKIYNLRNLGCMSEYIRVV